MPTKPTRFQQKCYALLHFARFCKVAARLSIRIQILIEQVLEKVACEEAYIVHSVIVLLYDTTGAVIMVMLEFALRVFTSIAYNDSPA
jgi:hypothetical protein